jgi:hypothetical protein
MTGYLTYYAAQAHIEEMHRRAERRRLIVGERPSRVRRVQWPRSGSTRRIVSPARPA